MPQIGATKGIESAREMPDLTKAQAIHRLRHLMEEMADLTFNQKKPVPEELWNEKRELKAIIEHSK